MHDSGTAPPRPILELRDLTVQVPRGDGQHALLDDVSLSVERGETFCLVGESGCGKSLTAMAILRLLPAGLAKAGGTITVDGRDIDSLSARELQQYRGGTVGIVFQEPGAALNPVVKVKTQLAEVIRAHATRERGEITARSRALLERVGLGDVDRVLKSYPFELSGGMQQRVVLAMALAGAPALLLADEPTTALDVTVQAKVVGLLQRLQDELSMAMLFITHDLRLAATLAHRIGVMYAGHLVETGPYHAVAKAPLHPYSHALLEVVRGGEGERLPTIPGVVPTIDEMGPGCRFASRCPRVSSTCREEPPPVTTVDDGRTYRCYHPLDGSDPAREEPA